MQDLGAMWLYPIILVAGALQAWGPPMNGALRSALTNPWLASLISFLPVIAFLACLALCVPRPLPTFSGHQFNALVCSVRRSGGSICGHRRPAVRE